MTDTPSRGKPVTHNGETMSLTEWSRRLGGGDTLVSVRLSHGWSVADAVTVAPDMGRPHELTGTLREMADRLGSLPALARRLKVSVRTVQRWDAAAHSPKLESRIAIEVLANELGVTVERKYQVPVAIKRALGGG